MFSLSYRYTTVDRAFVHTIATGFRGTDFEDRRGYEGNERMWTWDGCTKHYRQSNKVFLIHYAKNCTIIPEVYEPIRN